MFGRTSADTQIGTLKRGWGKWHGHISVPGFEAMEVLIEIKRNEPLDPFVQAASVFSASFPEIKEQFAKDLYDLYSTYKKLDIQTGYCTDADFAEYPHVDSAANIWTALKPDYLRLGPPIHKYLGNSYLITNVAWPNPHYFQLFMQYCDDSFRAMHVEVVG